jgi:hypothetical protein
MTLFRGLFRLGAENEKKFRSVSLGHRGNRFDGLRGLISAPAHAVLGAGNCPAAGSSGTCSQRFALVIAKPVT